MIEDFLNCRLWVHVTENDTPLLDTFQNMLPHIRFCSGDELNGRVMLSALHCYKEIWIRCDDKGCSYVGEYPRTSSCRELSPWIYDYGEIVDLEDFLGKKFELEENEFEGLFKGV